MENRKEKETDILDWNQYQKEDGKLSYHQWIQCLIDSGNITKRLGNRAIEIYDEGKGILSLPHQIRHQKHTAKIIRKLNKVLK